MLTLGALAIVSVDENAFHLVGMTEPGSLLPYYALLPQITLFGVGYALVGVNLSRNHAMIVLGAVGKTIFFLAVLYYYLRRRVNLIPLVLLTGDMIQVCLFVEFLVRIRRPSRSQA